ncbi:polymeric immunoglobulin receptor-like [Lepisosteus oculatus]|uniref:polymeric immunoglobulin receptor-like n=1 Tax=Lepisosteus oculatus TaxID=7918 RepID=UPI003718B14C
MKLLAFLTALPGVFSWLQLTGLKGGSLSIPCIYDMKYRNHMKYWCRGPSWIFCSILKKSITQQRDTDSLLISDNKSQRVHCDYEGAEDGTLMTLIKRGLYEKDMAQVSVTVVNNFYYMFSGSFGFFMQNNRLTGLAERQLDVPCEYGPALQSYVKMWCKGMEVRSCKVLRGESTDTSSRVSTTDNRTQRVFTVTLRRLSPEDVGWYWCTTEKKEYKIPLDLTVQEDKTSLCLT